MAPFPPLLPCCQLCPCCSCSCSPRREQRGGAPGGQALWQHLCSSPGAAAPRFQPPAEEQGPAGPGRRRVWQSPPGISAGRPAAGARLFSAGATRRSLQTAPGAPGASRCSRRCWGSQCSQCVLLLPVCPGAPSAVCCSLEHPSAPRAPNAPGGLSASWCSRGSSCSQCIPVLPVHLGPSHWSLVLPSQRCWQGHSTQQHSSPIPTLTPQDPTSHSAVPWEATGKGQIQTRAFPEPSGGPQRTWGAAAVGLIPEVAGQQWDVGHRHRAGGYEGDEYEGAAPSSSHTSGQGCAWCWRRMLCCWARLLQALGFEAAWTSPLLSAGRVAPSSPAPSSPLGLGASDSSRHPP